MKPETVRRRSPLSWVPTVYFAMGLPFILVNMVSTLMFRGLGIDDARIALWTSLIILPWSLKPIWSPLMEMFRTKKFWVVSTQLISGLGLALTALIACGIVYLMTKNGFVSLILAAVLEAGLIGGYLWDSSRFEGLFPQIISQLSLFARFYTIVNGVFDVTAIVYYLSVTGFFLFLSVQSLEKRRWSE